jgi:putative transposase
MAGTFSQIYIHIVFTVQNKLPLLQKPRRVEVFKYISGIIKAKGQKPIIVNGVSDHVHVFIGMTPAMAVANLVRDIKNNSTNFINKNKYVPVKFGWQGGYGSFSYSHSQIDKVYSYILNQDKHHRQKSFKEEYPELSKRSDIKFDEGYLFDWIE